MYVCKCNQGLINANIFKIVYYITLYGELLNKQKYYMLHVNFV